MSQDTDNPLAELETVIGYRFGDRDLLQRALTHPSWTQLHAEDEHYQRLEFLGDAVLSLILAGELYKILPSKREGALTRARSALSRGKQLASLAVELGLPKHLRLSEAEERNGGRQRESILEDIVEAVIGGIYVDGGYEMARTVVLSWYGNLRERLKELLSGHNPKGQLQEKVQPTLGNEAIKYRVLEESGPPHDRTFKVVVEIDGQAAGEGVGGSKKEAEENAAREALLGYEDEPESDGSI